MMPLHMIILLRVIVEIHTLSVIEQDSGLVSVSAGDNVTLHCSYQGSMAMHFSWYQQTLGGKPQLLSTIYKYDKVATLHNQFTNQSRFSVQSGTGINHLNIAGVRSSDSATYYCGSAYSNMIEFGEGIFLSVKESNFKAITQQPVSETVQPGDSVTLSCTVHTETCDGGHSVYWFRQGYQPGVIHSLEDQCKKTSRRGSPAQSCVYHLQKRNIGPSDAGMYYCAVASCGEILFGNGSRLGVDNSTKTKDFTAQMAVLVLLSISRAGLLLFFVALCCLYCAAKRW